MFYLGHMNHLRNVLLLVLHCPIIGYCTQVISFIGDFIFSRILFKAVLAIGMQITSVSMNSTTVKGKQQQKPKPSE